MKHSRVVSLLVWLAIGCAFVGFLDATYLTANHLKGTLPPCTLSGGCEKVLNSSFASIGPIPVALLGMAYYVTTCLLGVAYIDRGNPKVLRLMMYVSIVGIVVSGVMVYIQLSVLRSICQYCMVSALCCLLYGALTQFAHIGRLLSSEES